MPGPLTGLRVLELASLAPAPFACTVLSDLGAEVLRVDRAAAVLPGAPRVSDPLTRGRRSVAVDLKRPEGVATVLRLAEQADVLVEGFRPGVCERLGLGPEVCLERNPRLVYARMTGYGQHGPLADRAGHDINYLALSGALEPLGPGDGPPLPPLNYVADFGGGGMLLAVGVLSALWERERSGRGQVVDASMVEGAALLSGIVHGLHAQGLWKRERGGNIFDGSAPWYRTYACADGRFVAVGALEPQFWQELTARLEAVFATRTRDEWAELLEDTDACVTPVLSPFEAPEHPHHRAREAFVAVDGHAQPAPAPRFSRTPGSVASGSPTPGEHTRTALADWGLDPESIDGLTKSGALREG